MRITTRSPRIVVAPDAFKGTYDARAVANAIAAGVGRGARVLPLADGGEGTVELLCAALGGTLAEAEAHDPLGRPIVAVYARLPRRVAVVGAAEASGLALLRPEERDPLRASTRGTGELIAAAVSAGARRVLVAVGGTATVDGGLGAVECLEERDIRIPLRVLCDVRTPWEHAARMYGPQKGADEAAVSALEARLAAIAARAPRDPRGVPFSGAGGGLAGGLWAFAGAELAAGAGAVAHAAGLDRALAAADAVVTGEGRLDRQTLEGKVVSVVAAEAARAGIPCHAVVGSCESREVGAVLGLASVTVASTERELREAGRAIAARLTGA